MSIKQAFLRSALIFLTALSGCYRAPKEIEPCILPPPHPKEVQMAKRSCLFLPEDFSISPFVPLTEEEAKQDWGREYKIGLAFAFEFELYRAITSFKRALYLLPTGAHPRREEMEYGIALAYFLGKKYIEVVYMVESTTLKEVDSGFPAFDDLLVILYESYQQIDKPDCAEHVLKLMERENPDQARQLILLEAVREADFETLACTARADERYAYVEKIMCAYRMEAKSVRKAEFLNAIFPGAGYWYVGMRQTAVTAFLVNSLFLAAAVHFIDNGNIAAGLITLSLESGWYFGGIYGAGLAAKYYNEKMYCCFADKIAQKEEFFPILMLQYTF